MQNLRKHGRSPRNKIWNPRGQNRTRNPGMQELRQNYARSHRGQGHHRQFPRLRGKSRDQSRSHIRRDRRGTDAPRLLWKSSSHTTLRSKLGPGTHSSPHFNTPSLVETCVHTSLAVTSPRYQTSYHHRDLKSVRSRDARVPKAGFSPSTSEFHLPPA